MARTINKVKDMSRLRRFAQNHLGVIMGDEMSTGRIFRDNHLDLLDQYYDGTQYDDKVDWEDAMKSPEYVAIRDRKPRINYRLGKTLVDRVAAKLIGSSTFPQFIIEDDDDDTAFFRTVQKACKFRRNMIEPMKHLLISGSVFVRYYLSSGTIQMEWANAKYCYPVLDAVGELDSVEIKYVYDDPNDIDGQGNPRKKWYRLILGKMADQLFDTPAYREGVKPTFELVATAEHGLGWVQGEWFVTHKDKFCLDGTGLFEPILDFIDDLNYSLSQSSQAISYNQEPQLGVTNVDEDELDALIKSSQKAWNLGREGKAEYIESDMGGVERASEERDKFRTLLLDVVRVVIHDPEKLAGSAQSGTALNILHGPLVELVDELRAIIEPNLTNLLIKVGMTALHYNSLGQDTVLSTPPNYLPSSLDITVQWPPIFPPTLQDIQLMAQAAQSLSQGKIISRESLTRWVASVIPSVDNVEEELKKIDAEPDLNPFGSFGGGEPQ